MKTINAALRALSHPTSLLCIFLLLVNDRFLKVYAPSPLTGKLSDFAGLFFFPFLLIALLGLLMEPLGFQTRKIGAAGFGLTFIWFIGIKTIPVMNEFTETFVGKLVGNPIQIMLDPTDLLALFSLWPAWEVWKISDTYQKRFVKWIALVGLIASAWGTMATSCAVPGTIDRIIYENGILYVNSGYTQSEYGVSTNGGDTWERNGDKSFPEIISLAFAEKVSYPKMVCIPGDNQLCYQTTGTDQIEISRDGGASWQVDWEIPAERQYFMKRAGGSLVCGKTPDFEVFDLIVIPHGSEYRIIAAMGNEGILVKTGEGSWVRQGVLFAQPTPWQANSLSKANWTIYIEILMGIGLAILLFGLLTFRAAYTVANKTPPIPGKKWWWPLSPVLWGILFSAVIGVVLLFFGFRASRYLSFLIYAIPIYFLISLIIMWVRTFYLSQTPQWIGQALKTTFLSGLACGISIWIAFLLWAYNVIPSYTTTSWIAGLFYLTLTYWSWTHVGEYSISATLAQE